MYVIGNIPRLPVFNIHGIPAVEAGAAQGKLPRHGLQIPDFHIAQGICPDQLPDFLFRMGGGDQLPVGRDIRPEITGMKEGRRTDPHMDAFGTGLFQKMNQVGNGGAADNGIIHQHQAFPADRRRKNIQFQPNAGLPLLLGGLDKGSAT